MSNDTTPNPSNSMTSPMASDSTIANPTSLDFSRPLTHSLPNIGIKLDNTNFLLWKTRFKPFLRAYHMLDIVEGKSISPTSPPASLADVQRWADQDQLALGWILSTVDDFITTQLISCDSSHAAWTTLEKNFSRQTQARAMQLREEFDAIKKGALSMTAYLNKAKLLADSLAAIGRPLSSDELLSRVLHGLGPDYAGFRSMLRLSERVHSIESLYGPLLNHEASLLLDGTITVDAPFLPVVVAPSPSINLTSRTRQTPWRQHSPSPNSHPLLPNSTPRPPRGSGRGQRGVRCQICNRHGHSAATCYKSIQPATLTTAQSSTTNSVSSSTYSVWPPSLIATRTSPCPDVASQTARLAC